LEKVIVIKLGIQQPHVTTPVVIAVRHPGVKVKGTVLLKIEEGFWTITTVRNEILQSHLVYSEFI
jgi:hypothetical protein